MNAVLDIGNSRIKVALFDGREFKAHRVFAHSELEEVSTHIRQVSVDKVISSSTAESAIMPEIEQDVDHLILRHDTRVPLKVKYDGETLGMDRLADAVGLSRLHGPVGLVIDMGSCVTYNRVVDNTFVGGGISPGYHMRLKAMNAFTGRLPLVSHADEPPLVANNTSDSLRSGAYYGLLYELRGHIDVFRMNHPKADVILTGGDAERFAHDLKKAIFVDPLHTLRGLNEILLHHYED